MRMILVDDLCQIPTAFIFFSRKIQDKSRMERKELKERREKEIYLKVF